MTKTIFKNTFLVGISVLLLCALLFFGLQYRQTINETYVTLQQEAEYAEGGLLLSGAAYLESLGNINRITWFAADGSVLYDSETYEDMESPDDMPEIYSARTDGEGKDIRRSAQSGNSTIYYARQCSDGTILRLSRPRSGILTAVAAVSPVLWIIVLVLMISGALAFRAAKQIVEPINAIDLDKPDTNTHAELSPLISRIQIQKLTIQEQIDELKKHQEEFSALTSSMNEGFLLLDREWVILSVNETARQLLSAGDIGEPFQADANVQAAVKDALSGKHAESMLDYEGQTWEFIANPVLIHGKSSGAVLLMVNVTEREQRERLRQEFSANVSHELKTPLTSISGFAELMAGGMVPQEKTQEFASDIYREAQRLIALIDDIIKLSKLDEGGMQAEWQTVELHDVVEDVLDSLRNTAEKRHVTMTQSGETATVQGVSQLLHETIYNLCDNAIKYNKDGGSVDVMIRNDAAGVQLCVSDTGIGIPYAEQDRVFERFYRVDKSHSKEVGGTGLGLSIVKHAAQLHGAVVSLESHPDQGTAITLTFPAHI